MKSKTISFILLLCLSFLLICGCATKLRNHAKDVAASYVQQVEKHVKSRKAQLDVRLGFLNDDMLTYKFDSEKIEKIKAEINKLHEEQRFLYTLNYGQFKLDYEIVEEYKNEESLRELIMKVKGKTINLDKEGRSEVIEIPKEASYWLFKEIITNNKTLIIGPLSVPKEKLKELTEENKKSFDK